MLSLNKWKTDVAGVYESAGGDGLRNWSRAHFWNYQHPLLLWCELLAQVNLVVVSWTSVTKLKLSASASTWMWVSVCFCSVFSPLLSFCFSLAFPWCELSVGLFCLSVGFFCRTLLSFVSPLPFLDVSSHLCLSYGASKFRRAKWFLLQTGLRKASKLGFSLAFPWCELPSVSFL